MPASGETASGQIFALVDVNNFYVSCERVFNPSLEALARQHGIVALSSNYALYADMSSRVVSILREYSPNVEVYSIDESFLGLNGLDKLWPSFAGMGQSMLAGRLVREVLNRAGEKP